MSFHPDSNLPNCMMPDGGDCCAGHAAVCEDWHKQRRRIEQLEAALQTADEALSMVQAAGVKGVPHGMDLNYARSVIASAARAAPAERGTP